MMTAMRQATTTRSRVQGVRLVVERVAEGGGVWSDSYIAKSPVMRAV